MEIIKNNITNSEKYSIDVLHDRDLCLQAKGVFALIVSIGADSSYQLSQIAQMAQLDESGLRWYLDLFREKNLLETISKDDNIYHVLNDKYMLHKNNKSESELVPLLCSAIEKKYSVKLNTKNWSEQLLIFKDDINISYDMLSSTVLWFCKNIYLSEMPTIYNIGDLASNFRAIRDLIKKEGE